MKFDERTTYNFYADLHLNPFGKHPKMFRGLVIRDRSLPFLPKRLLRPVVATFTGKGTGKDTADFSYKGRRGNTAWESRVVDEGMERQLSPTSMSGACSSNGDQIWRMVVEICGVAYQFVFSS